MFTKSVMLFLSTMIITTKVLATSCVDSADDYAYYDNKVAAKEINDLRSQYYVLSYTWSPNHCAKVSAKSKKAGAKNYLQCANKNKFGYILHGLWPQGGLKSKRGYPRACGGDKPKIPRAQLAPYLCMTPSAWLLQHEYEYHGTCMPSASLKTPSGYFDQAKKMHQTLVLPTKELKHSAASFRWWYKNNPQLAQGSVQYWHGGSEWQVCYDQQFNSRVCPANGNKSTGGLNAAKPMEQYTSKSSHK